MVGEKNYKWVILHFLNFIIIHNYLELGLLFHFFHHNNSNLNKDLDLLLVFE